MVPSVPTAAREAMVPLAEPLSARAKSVASTPVTASEKVDIRDGGSVDGDIVSPRVAIAEGAHFRGTVDMQRKAAAGQQAQTVKPAAAAAANAPQPQVAAH